MHKRRELKWCRPITSPFNATLSTLSLLQFQLVVNLWSIEYILIGIGFLHFIFPQLTFNNISKKSLNFYYSSFRHNLLELVTVLILVTLSPRLPIRKASLSFSTVSVQLIIVSDTQSWSTRPIDIEPCILSTTTRRHSISYSLPSSPQHTSTPQFSCSGMSVRWERACWMKISCW